MLRFRRFVPFTMPCLANFRFRRYLHNVPSFATFVASFHVAGVCYVAVVDMLVLHHVPRCTACCLRIAFVR